MLDNRCLDHPEKPPSRPSNYVISDIYYVCNGPIASWALVKGSGASLRAKCDYYAVIAACCTQIGT
jgi:hypothetical protein